MKKQIYKKIVAVLTVISFLLTGVFESSFAMIGTNMPTINDITFESMLLPNSLGKITSAKYYDSNEIVINIQDLHCHAQTQKQISSIIEYLDNIYKLDNVYLEGAFNKVDTTWLSAFNKSENGIKVLEGLINNGKLSGTEYYSIMNNKKDFIIGIEDEKLYKQNIKLLGEIIKLQPEINAICTQLEEQINKIKKEYTSRKARNLDLLISKFNSKKIDTKEFYIELSKYIKDLNISIKQYPNISMYMGLIDNGYELNSKKVIAEFSSFMLQVKNILSYQQYLDLLNRSNNFKNIDNISTDLNIINTKYEITKKLKLYNFEKILMYFNFNSNINPIELVKEEDVLIDEIFNKLGRTKFEKEVAFLSKFIPTIKQYFTAEISADEYATFEEEFNKFKKVWVNYLAGTKINELNKYKELLSKYHRNNIVRNEIFAKHIIKETKNNNKNIIEDTSLAIEQIKNNINKKQIKLVVTGGFHTRGLEKIFEKEKISYIIITPKITQPIEQAKQIYQNNVMYYSNLLKNTINIKPLTQEPLNISFPKIISNIFSIVQSGNFEVNSQEEIKEAIIEFVEENIISKQSTFYGKVEIVSWNIVSKEVSKGKVEIEVKYKDNANKSTISDVKYLYNLEEIIAYSKIDTTRTKSMLERITTNKYALPSIELEPTNRVRKQILKHILTPLEEVAGNKISLMPYKQLHITVGYDGTQISQSDIDNLVDQKDTTTDIFSVTDILRENLTNFKATLSGTLKLMPDGVIIYEITDSELIKQMMSLREILKDNDAKYKTPSIVHMSIGRITDKSLLENTEQSKEELAQLLEKLNERIYDINKKNALSKIKSTFNLKSGYVSSTGDKDYIVKQVFPKAESLVVFENLFSKSNKIIDTLYKIIVAPIVEEIFFRYIPFVIAVKYVPLTITPSLLIPTIITTIVGVLGFSIAHPLADKIINQNQIRNWKDFLLQSSLVTTIYLALTIAFPEIPLIATITTMVLHSINNILAEKGKLNLLSILTLYENQQVPEIDQSLVDKLLEQLNSISGDNAFNDMINSMKEKLSNLSDDYIERYNIISEQINILFDEALNYISRGASLCPSYNYYLDYIYPFITFVKKQGGQDLLFISFLQFIIDGNFGEYKQGPAIEEIIKTVLPMNREYLKAIIDKLLEKGLIKYDEQTPDFITHSLKKYEDLKFYYLQISKKSKLDKKLSKDLISFCKKMSKYDLSPKCENILYEMDYLTDSINSTTAPLLEYLLNDLFVNINEIQEKESFIVDVLLPLYKSLAENKNINEKKLSDLFSMLKTVYIDKNSSDKDFVSMFNYMLDIAKVCNKEASDAICDYLAEIILIKYSSQDKDVEIIDEHLYDLFEQFASELTNNLDIYGYLFGTSEVGTYMLRNIGKHVSSPGLNERTLKIYLKALENSKYKDVSFIIPKNSKIKDIEEVSNLLVSNFNKLDLFILSLRFSRAGDKGKKLSVKIVNNLTNLLDDKNLDFSSKQIIVETLAKMASSEIYSILYEYNLFDINVINNLCRDYNINIFLQPNFKSYIISNREKRESLQGEYSFTPLLQMVSKDSLEDDISFVNEPPIMYRTVGTTNYEYKKVELIVKKFDVLQDVLNYNNIVLSLIDGLSKSKNPQKDFEELIKILKDMIDSLEFINKEHGIAARKALDTILKKLSLGNILEVKKEISFTPSMIRNLVSLKQWDEKNIANITEIHTLINAIHQTSISDFKTTIDDISQIGDNLIKTISATHENPEMREGFFKTGVKLYDLSKDKLNPNIIDFIGKLSQTRLPFPRAVDTKPDYQIDDFVCKDDFVVWTTRLFAHSVDIFMNFSDTERGITIAYHESGRQDGNAQRIEYFSTILEKLGFSVEKDTRVSWSSDDGVCSLKAVLNRDCGLNDDVDMTEIATQVISLFKHSDMLDWDLGEEFDRYSRDSYMSSFNRLVEKFMNGYIWYKYNPDSTSGWNGSLIAIPQKSGLDIEELKSILSSLDLVNELPRFGIEQKDLDTLFNNVIERAFAVGRLIVDDKGDLKKNDNYDIITYLAQSIAANEEESLNNSRLINLLPKYKLNFRTVGYIGDLIAISGYLKLKNGMYLSVKGLINPTTKRMKYSDVEFVTNHGRKNVKSNELRKILINEGFDINEQEWINKSEQKRISKLLHRKVQMIDASEIRGISTSGADGTYKMGFVTTDRDKVDENSVFVTSYTTPDDIERIKTAKAIITTGGGVLSHAAITTREYKKPSVIINGTNWNDGKLNISYYSPLGTPFDLDGLSIRKISEEKTTLKEGTRVLINGETGHVLLFNDIDSSILDTLQEALENDDSQVIKQLLINYSDNKDIRKIIEYVYFQTIGNSKLQNTLDVLFGSDMPENIKNKIKELNEGYIQDKIISIEEGISNLQRISNTNIMYSIVEMLKEKLDFIKTPDEREDIEKLKNMVLIIRERNKNDLYEFIDNIIKESQEYINKTDLSIKELNRAVDIVQQANVYEMFVAENEERQDLQEIKTRIKEVVEQLDKKIKECSNRQDKYKNQILSFDKIQGFDVHRFGSKTTELAKMFRLLQNRTDAIVPKGVGVSSNVLDIFMESIGKKEEFNILITTFEQAIRDKDLDLAKGLAEQIRSLIESGKKELKTTLELRNELLSAVEQTLANKHYSVRSSGVGEDSANNAFAGMGETILNVSKDNLYDSLLTCWESFYSERSIEYMINSNQIVRPAVLVQEMIDVDKAGVIFSRDKYGNATIEALYGLGEGIVSGKLTPDTIAVDMATGEVLEYSVATKDYKIISTQEGVERVTVETGSKERALDYESIRHLTEIVNVLEKDAGYKLDIEFGIKDGTIYILQRRPITTNDQVKTDVSEDIEEFVEQEDSLKIKHQISLISGTISDDKEVFVNIANPLSPTESIPIYLKAVNGEVTEFVVDTKYENLVRSEVLGKILLHRINKDIAVLDKLNGNIFNCKAGEIELLPVLQYNLEQKKLIEEHVDMQIENTRRMLASA